MKTTRIKMLEDWFASEHEYALKGRHIVSNDILPLLKKLPIAFKVNKIGASFLKNDIYKVSIGKGSQRILIWTQMHGNESTGTKALFDLFNFFSREHKLSVVADKILRNCTIVCIPILNPDGALAYTRVNAQNIDLNRDVIDKKAVESRILQDLLKEVDPHFCFNMHDQRTIFSVGKANNPATLSFLAPSTDVERTLTEGRKQTMAVIMSMHNLLEKCIPNQIGRYTDEFYPTATGDNFQKMGHNTILIESGHFKGDYSREETRKFTFYALLQGIDYISDVPKSILYKDYFDIPNNEKFYLDIILKNVDYKGKSTDVGFLFEERLEGGQLYFIPKIEKEGDLSNYNADKTIPGHTLSFSDENKLIDWVKNEIN
ncbi:MAG: M14 family zinc carboxypeptidase [Flavobacteriaceae bacterium]|nr:M14 family zinc carboxypeptidase [Flavobacteriaceae bacterium]